MNTLAYRDVEFKNKFQIGVVNPSGTIYFILDQDINYFKFKAYDFCERWIFEDYNNYRVNELKLIALKLSEMYDYIDKVFNVDGYAVGVSIIGGLVVFLLRDKNMIYLCTEPILFAEPILFTQKEIKEEKSWWEKFTHFYPKI